MNVFSLSVVVLHSGSLAKAQVNVSPKCFEPIVIGSEGGNLFPACPKIEALFFFSNSQKIHEQECHMSLGSVRV